MFQLDKIYKHKYNTDVAFKVKGIHSVWDLETGGLERTEPAGMIGYRLIGYWYNVVNPKNIFPIWKEDVIFIKKEDKENWKEYLLKGKDA